MGTGSSKVKKEKVDQHTELDSELDGYEHDPYIKDLQIEMFPHKYQKPEENLKVDREITGDRIKPADLDSLSVSNGMERSGSAPPLERKKFHFDDDQDSLGSPARKYRSRTPSPHKNSSGADKHKRLPFSESVQRKSRRGNTIDTRQNPTINVRPSDKYAHVKSHYSYRGSKNHGGSPWASDSSVTTTGSDNSRKRPDLPLKVTGGKNRNGDAPPPWRFYAKSEPTMGGGKHLEKFHHFKSSNQAILL